MIPLKKYAYDDWVRIAAQNNALRAQQNQTLGYQPHRVWTGADSWDLWQSFFSERA